MERFFAFDKIVDWLIKGESTISRNVGVTTFWAIWRLHKPKSKSRGKNELVA